MTCSRPPDRQQQSWEWAGQAARPEGRASIAPSIRRLGSAGFGSFFVSGLPHEAGDSTFVTLLHRFPTGPQEPREKWVKKQSTEDGTCHSRSPNAGCLRRGRMESCY